MSIQFTLTSAEDGTQNLAVFTEGQLVVMDSTNPNFREALAAANGSQPIPTDRLLNLFSITNAVRDAFQQVTDRVRVDHGVVYLDDEPVEGAITRQIVRLFHENAPLLPLVRFLEKIDANPSYNSRNQAYEWFNNHDITITEDGDVIAYKGVYNDGNGGYRSGHQGTASVNGELYERTYIPNAVGDVVEMDRRNVADDPSSACSAGLHVGTYDYARGYAQGAMLKVRVDPADVVSVPHDAAGEKIRVARYEVLGIISEPTTSAFERAPVDVSATQYPQEGDLVRDLEDGEEGEVVRGDDGRLEIILEDTGYWVTLQSYETYQDIGFERIG